MKPLIALSLAELRALLLKTIEHDDVRSYVLFLVIVAHGLRVTEAISLERPDFTRTAKAIYLTVQRLKGSKKTVQQLLVSPDPLFNEKEVVVRYLSSLKGDYLFTNKDGAPLTRWGVNFLIEQYGRWAGIPEHKRFPHALKHTCGVLMRQAGCDLEEIQEALGHVKLDSTAQYLRVSSDEVDAARASIFNVSAAQAQAAGAV